ncbi:LytTR family transcriptional regulator DNA-binding domain-containing protein [Paenibacillus amylolyticus]|uniref:LytTR family transcriptional regulator DNA-binding domain-containing protein n=1 Tax=Paenibacillus amylolyticus TaxID=1451 RepID=A0ABD8B3Z8_PAEAM
MLGTKVTDNEIDQAAKIKVSDLLAIDLWEPKNNVRVPLFHSADIRITVPTSIRECQAIFSHFSSFYQGVLVNLQAVEYIKDTIDDYEIRFIQSAFKTIIRHDDIPTYKRYMYEYQIHEPQPTRCPISMLVIDIESRAVVFLPAEDVIMIDLWDAKANYRVPRFYTRDRTYTVPLTIEMCHHVFPDFFPSDTGNLVNLDGVEHIESTPYQAYLKFENCELRAPLAQYKVRHLKKIFPLIKQ